MTVVISCWNWSAVNVLTDPASVPDEPGMAFAVCAFMTQLGIARSSQFLDISALKVFQYNLQLYKASPSSVRSVMEQ